MVDNSRPRTASDASYHHRHTRRSQQRAECIAAQMATPGHVLDVGCNVGITSRHLLTTGAARQVTGIELSADTVDPDLVRDRRFTLIEGDITSTDPVGDFDYVIYGAVHHHVLHYHGLSAAVAALQKLIGLCRESLFFETGQLGEGGRWPWQQSMHRYFSTDEEHLHYLLACIEERISDFEIIGRFWIHGIRRSYLRIDVRPERQPPGMRAPAIETTTPVTMDLGRTFGSRSQQLVNLGDAGVADSPALFGYAEHADGRKLFLKRHVHRPLAAEKEYQIGTQVPHAWAVRCIGTIDDAPTLAFPLVDQARSMHSVVNDDPQQRRRIAAQVVRIFDEARQTTFTMKRHLLLPANGPVSLLQVCDMNGNNLLVTGRAEHTCVFVVDFEQQSTHYLHRNRLHLARILIQLRCFRGRAATEYALGLAGLAGLMLRNQWQPLRQRILDRQPAALSVAIVRARSLAGRALGAVLRRAGVE